MNKTELSSAVAKQANLTQAQAKAGKNHYSCKEGGEVQGWFRPRSEVIHFLLQHTSATFPQRCVVLFLAFHIAL